MRIIVSRNPQANKDFIFKEIDGKIKDKKRVYYLVPEQSSLASEIDIFNNFDFKSTIDLKVKSFRSIVDEILTKCGGKRNNFINEQAQKLIIKICMKEVEKDLVSYKKSIYQEDFADLILKFIKTAKSSLVGPNDLLKMLEDEGLGDSLNRKLGDIYLIYSRYEEIIKGSYFDGNDRLEYATEQAHLMDEFKDISFYIDQFNSMSSQELSLIKEIDKLSENVNMALTLDPSLVGLARNQPSESVIEDGAVFDLSRSFLDTIGEMMNYDLIVAPTFAHDNPDLDRLLRSTFSYRLAEIQKAKKGLTSVHISKYKNTEEECESLAIKINKDIFEKELRFRDIAVVVSNKEEYFERVKRLFKLNDIPYFIDSHRNILENPMAKYLKSSLKLLSSNFSHTDIISYMKNSFFQLERDKLNYFQNYLIERRFVGDMIFDDKYFIIDKNSGLQRSKYAEEDLELIDFVAEIRSLFLDSISPFIRNYDELLEKRRSKEKILYYCEKVYEFISNPKSVERLAAYEKRLDALNRSDIIDENRLVWKNFVGILDSFASLSPNLELNFTEFISYLTEAIDDIKIGIVPPGQDQVQVGDFERSRFMGVKKLYILGMTNSYFPKDHKSADIFVDSEKEKLLSLGLEIKDSNDLFSKRDLFAFYNLLTKSKEEILISYSLIDGGNAPMQKAQILTYIEKIIDANNINDLGENYRDYAYSKSKLAYYLPTKLREIKSKGLIEKEEKDFILSTIDRISQNSLYDNIYTSISKADNMLKKSNKLNKRAVSFAYPDTKSFSVSQVESYISCPYRHFIRYGISPRDKGDYSIDLISYGNISHDVLDKFVGGLAGSSGEEFLDEGGIEKTIAGFFPTSVNKYVEGYKLEDSKNRYFLNKLNKNLELSCYAVQEQIRSLSLDRIYTEEEYGRGKKFPALKVQVGDKTYEMEGKIDRVDSFSIADKNYYSVIDYKTGRKSFDINRVYHGLDLQLMVYLYTIINSGGNPFGAFYMNLNHKFIDLSKTDEIYQYLLKKVKLSGLAINDLDVLTHFDKSFNPDDNPNSLILDLKYNIKDYQKQDHLVDKKVFDMLFERVIYNIKNSIENIKAGDIEVKPYRIESKSPCAYCPYKSICRFENDNYNFIEPIKDKDLIKKLGEKDG